MIRGSRRAHRLVWPLLTIATLTLLVLGLRSRPEWPAAELPAVIAAPAMIAGGTVQVWDDDAIRSRRDRGGVLELEVAPSFATPLLVLYWSPARGAEDAGAMRPLGSVGQGRERFLLPDAADGGELVLYSLRTGAVVARAPLGDGDAG